MADGSGVGLSHQTASGGNEQIAGKPERAFVSEDTSWAARRKRKANKRLAVRAARMDITTEFLSAPEPRTIGSFARGKQLIAGQFLFGGHYAERPGRAPWDMNHTDLPFEEEVHGFDWLDDLAAVGDGAARTAAQEWTGLWIDRFGFGSGPGWTPHVVGRRITRWMTHGLMLLQGGGDKLGPRLFRSLAQQATFLSWQWEEAAPGLPRMEALSGLIHAGLTLARLDSPLPQATQAMAEACRTLIGVEGGLPSRNAEELLEVFSILTATATALSEAGEMVDRDQIAAIERIAPTLRSLRHSDGGLARFHGGGRGLAGRLDHALVSSGVRGGRTQGLAMGFVRLNGGRTSLILDAAPPPGGKHAATGHASTLAIELTSGRRPVIVNCGSGLVFGTEWHRAGRATPSHSTLSLDGLSSSRLSSMGRKGGRADEVLSERPHEVRQHQTQTSDATSYMASHDGYVRSHGLTHVRQINLSSDGRSLSGDDTLAALQDRHKPAFLKARKAKTDGVPFAIRFHLHPDVDATLDMGGAAVSMALKSGEIWVFRHRGMARLALEPSVYLERGRLEPRPTKQIVLHGLADDFATRVGWTLAKAQDTPKAVRDLTRDSLETTDN